MTVYAAVWTNRYMLLRLDAQVRLFFTFFFLFNYSTNSYFRFALGDDAGSE
jgi:hypothetical protein